MLFQRLEEEKTVYKANISNPNQTLPPEHGTTLFFSCLCDTLKENNFILNLANLFVFSHKNLYY